MLCLLWSAVTWCICCDPLPSLSPLVFIYRKLLQPATSTSNHLHFSFPFCLSSQPDLQLLLQFSDHQQFLDSGDISFTLQSLSPFPLITVMSNYQGLFLCGKKNIIFMRKNKSVSVWDMYLSVFLYLCFKSISLQGTIKMLESSFRHIQQAIVVFSLTRESRNILTSWSLFF